MIIFRVIWALFLAGMLGYAFHRAWGWEHGKPSNKGIIFDVATGKETVVWVSPTFLIWAMVIILAIQMLSLGISEGVIHFAVIMLDIILTFSVYFLLLLAFLPLLRKKFSARACAVLWVVPVFMFYNAAQLLNAMPLPKLTLYFPQNVFKILLMVWILGFLVVEGYYIFSHMLFCRRVKRNASPVLDADILAIWQKVLDQLEYKRPVNLLKSAAASTPFSMGRTKFTRCTVLPARDYTEEELQMIFRHELHHLQRCDVDTKVFLAFCNSMCWFNPLVWIATRKAAEDLELSCDEIVTEDMDEGQRKAYAGLLLSSAAPQQGYTTCLSAAAGTLQYRLKNIMTKRKRFPGTVLLMLVLFCCTLCFGTVALTDDQGSYTELLLPEGTEIESIYVQHEENSGFDVVYAWDESKLRDTLNNITLEHLTGIRKHVRTPGPMLELIVVNNGERRYVSLFKESVKSNDLEGTSDYYLIKSPVDWEALFAVLDFDAEDSERRLDKR